MDIREAAGKIDILQAASPASMAALIPCAALKRFQKGDHLFFDKDDVNHVYFLVSGKASLYKLSNTQEKKVVFVYGGGSMLNEVVTDYKPASINCEFLSDSLVLYFEIKRFLYVCQQDFGLTGAVMESMALKIRRLYRQMKNTSNNVRGDRRIAAKLWKLSRDHGVSCDDGIKIDLDLTVTYLADLLGSKRETVSRQLKQLSELGLVIMDKTDKTEKKRFIIPDRDKLMEYYNQP